MCGIQGTASVSGLPKSSVTAAPIGGTSASATLQAALAQLQQATARLMAPASATVGATAVMPLAVPTARPALTAQGVPPAPTALTAPVSQAYTVMRTAAPVAPAIVPATVAPAAAAPIAPVVARPTAVAGATGTAATGSQGMAFLPNATLPNASIAAPASTGGEDNDFEQRVLDLVNQQRAAHGLAPVRYNAQLDSAARGHAGQMGATRTMAHDGIGDGDSGSRIRSAGFGRAWGENVAVGQTTPEQVVAEWMASPEHRANILDPKFTQLGVEASTGADGRQYWAQEFGA